MNINIKKEVYCHFINFIIYTTLTIHHIINHFFSTIHQIINYIIIKVLVQIFIY